MLYFFVLNQVFSLMKPPVLQWITQHDSEHQTKIYIASFLSSPTLNLERKLCKFLVWCSEFQTSKISTHRLFNLTTDSRCYSVNSMLCQVNCNLGGGGGGGGVLMLQGYCKNDEYLHL